MKSSPRYNDDDDDHGYGKNQEDLVEEIYILNEHGLNGAYAGPKIMRGLQEATRKSDERDSASRSLQINILPPDGSTNRGQFLVFLKHPIFVKFMGYCWDSRMLY